MTKLYFTISFLFMLTMGICQQNYKCMQYTIIDGLSHNTVESILKDSEGFIWFGTHNGLNRFDGTNFKTYQHSYSDTNSIAGNKVLSIAEDNDGFLWVSISGIGVSRFDKNNEVFYHFKADMKENNLPNNMVSNIKVLSDNSVWFCTNSGLAHYDSKTNTFINYSLPRSKDDLTNATIYDIIETKEGEIFIASSNEFIYRLDRNTKQFTEMVYERSPDLQGNYRKHIIEDESGNLWISALAHGLVRLNPQTGESKLFGTQEKQLHLELLYGSGVLNNNKLWITTDGAGIVIFDLQTEKFSAITQNTNKNIRLFSNKIYSLFIDDQGIVWVGTFNEGVNVLNPNQQKFGTLKNNKGEMFSLEGKSVLSVFEDSKSRLWLGTDGDGLYCYKNGGEITNYKHQAFDENSISSDRILCIAEDENGNILLGTYLGGLVVLNPEKNLLTRYLASDGNPNAIASDNVWDIFVDSKKRIWVGLLGSGLDLFNPKTGTFEHYGPQTDNFNRINHDNVMGIIEDSNGDIWFATEGRGVNILDQETNHMFHAICSNSSINLSNNNLRCVFEDTEGIIWLGTENGGLNRFDKNNEGIDYYSMDNGLPSDIIYSINEDEDKRIWLGTAYGISVFNKKTNRFRNYDVKDGLWGFMCNRKGLLKRANGSMLIGTTNGLNVVHPDSIYDIGFLPETFFTGLRIQNKVIEKGHFINGRIVLHKPINYTNNITIVPKDQIFTIEFAAKTFTLPNKCFFKYKLDGFEEDWKITEASRQHVSYSNLNPGKYKFKVKASNSDGVWSDKEAVLAITVLPTFWQSRWLKLLLTTLVLLMFYVWYRFMLKEKEKEFLREKNIQEQKIISLEKENLESELNNRTFNILNRNRSLIKHKRRLGALANKIDDKNRKTLEEIIIEIDHEINDEKDWKHVEPRLDKVYNNFMTILKSKHNNLTQNELRVAAYVRMGLSTKEISELLQKSIKAIDNERYRLRKKLDIPLNDSLKSYLLDL